MTQIIDRQGLAQEVSLSIDDYKAAFDAGLTLPQFLNRKFETDSESFGTPFEQVLASNNMFVRSDRRTGIKPPSMKDILSGNVDVTMGAITRPSGEGASTNVGRLLFPSVVLEMVEADLREDNSAYEGIVNRMTALNTDIDTPRADIPIINLSGPKSSRSQPIAQLAEPPRSVSITLSEKSIRMPTYSIMFQISDEAEKASTLDLVNIAVREQSNAERVARVDSGIQGMIDGDVDLGIAALTARTATSYDTAPAGTVTHKGWLKWLRESWKTLNIDWVITDIDTYLAVENRSGRPLAQQDDSNGARMNSIPKAANPGVPDNVNFFIVDTALIGANTLIGLDSSKAIRKVTYTGATYSAIEEFVLRRTKALRIDWSFQYFRLIDQAWKKLTLT